MKKAMITAAACVMLAAALMNGCTKKAAPAETTAAPTQAAPTTAAAQTAAAGGEDAALTDLIPVSKPESYGSVKLAQYKGVEVQQQPVEVTDEDVQDEIDYYLSMYPDVETVTGRAVESGDTVNIDYVGKKDGVAFEGGTDQGFDLEIGSGTFIPGFEDGLIGHGIGETVTLDLTFPEDYHAADLAGQKTQFDVTINGITVQKDAELTDDWVKANFTEEGQTTVEGLKTFIREGLEETRRKESMYAAQTELMKGLMDNSEFEINPIAVEYEYQNQLNYLSSMMTAYGMTLDSYAANFGMTADELKEELHEYGENVVRQKLVEEAIFEAEGMELTDEDYRIMADDLGVTVDEVISVYGEESAATGARSYKVVNFLYDNAVIK